MIIDDKLVLFDMVASGTSVNSKVLDLGTENVFLPLFLNVKLTSGKAGAVTSITVQSAATEAFGSPVTEVTYNIPSAVDQSVPCTLLQAFCPITPGNRYLRVVAAGASGGTLWGAITPDVQIQM